MGGTVLFSVLVLCVLIAGPAKLYIEYRKYAKKRRALQPAAIVRGPKVQEPSVNSDQSASLPQVTVTSIRSVTDFRPDQRQHTIIAARPGDGKTTTVNTLLLADIGYGAAVIVLNPHFTYYHPDDQRIDLRQLRDHILVAYEYRDIAATLQRIFVVVEQRLGLYRNGDPVGNNIVVYIDEWPAIAADETYGKQCATLLSKIVRQARKCNIWIVLSVQDALVETLQLSGGIRANFATRLVGNVDATTWRELLGRDIVRSHVAQGQWVAVVGAWQGIATVSYPTVREIARAVTLPSQLPQLEDCLSGGTAHIEVQPNITGNNEEVHLDAWLAERPRPTMREMTRRIYRLRGGTNPNYDGSGNLYTEVAALVEAREAVLLV